MTDAQPVGRRRDGAATKREAQRVALELFTAHGYESTSLRQIAEALGINKASLYYHFPSKEAILRSLFEQRGDEAEQLADWVAAQPRTEGLLERAVLRWVDSFSAEKLQGIRFLRSNPHVARMLRASDGNRIGRPLSRLGDLLVELLPNPTPTNALLLRMAVLSINAAVESAADAQFSDSDIVAAARAAARVLVHEATG